ncbi:MAG TPA: hypothetical protein VHE30_03585 [Polyangiaceae bacterium]|nr:hypothetical protein [Polyangiaceae bacterium]
MSAATGLCERLGRSIGRVDLLAARRAGEIAKSGVSPDGIEFEFHGIGCRLSADGTVVDVDFLPGGAFGFDVWRLHVFSSENVLTVGRRSAAEVQEALDGLVRVGEVEAIPGSRTFRWRTP